MLHFIKVKKQDKTNWLVTGNIFYIGFDIYYIKIWIWG